MSHAHGFVVSCQQYLRMAMFYVVIYRSGPQWDLVRLLEQQSGFAAHAEFMNDLVDTGVIVLGGPLVDEYWVIHVVEAEPDLIALYAIF